MGGSDYLDLVEDAEELASCLAVVDGPDGVPRINVEPAIVERDGLPELPEELVKGIIRKGGKLLVSGASKSGKSYLLIELAVAVATGSQWVSFWCTRGRVLYVNLEIQRPQFMHRVYKVASELGVRLEEVAEGLDIANLRGAYSDITALVDSLCASFARGRYDLIIIDPAYKVQMGHENDADAITLFCGELDRLAEALGTTIAYTHHHSKGAQGAKNAADRASGSGVFARDADALIDMIELNCDEDGFEARQLLHYRDAVPFRLEFVLRDFKQPKPLDIWFRYPIHIEDLSGMLEDCDAKRPGGKLSAANRQKSALAKIEAELDEVMAGRDEVGRQEFLSKHRYDKRTLKRYLEESERFELVTTQNYAGIRRVGSQGVVENGR